MATQYLNTCDHCGKTEQLPERPSRGWVNLTMHTSRPSSLYLSFDMCPDCFGDPNNLLLVVQKVMADGQAERDANSENWEEKDDARIDAGLKRLGYTTKG